MLYTVKSDEELIHGYVEGDSECFNALLDRHKQKVFGYILSVVQDYALAEDIFQDTFIKVVNTLRSGYYNEQGKFVNWVIRIAHNHIMDHFRKDKRLPTLSGKEGFDIFDVLDMKENSIEEKIITRQIHADVRRLIKLLPEEQRRVLVLRHYGNYSFKEIAKLTDVSINTALGRMRYALINMRKFAEENQMILTK